MRVLFLGRMRPQRKGARAGGIERSAALIVDGLRGVGDVVDAHDIRDPAPIAALPAPDVAYLYGDVELVPEHLAAIHRLAPTVPIAVNSAYDGSRTRTSSIIETFATWNKSAPGQLYAATFSPVPLSPIVRTVVAPKTIRPFGRRRPARPYADRVGVCLGDLQKTSSQRLTCGASVAEIVKRLAAERIRCTAVLQYLYPRPDDYHADCVAGLQIVTYQDDVLSWLDGFRVYLHLGQRETFAMVPLEAAGVGTPVVYRPQHSLDAYLGCCGARVETIDDALAAVTELYHDERLWAGYSHAGMLAARAHCDQGAALHMAFADLIRRHRRGDA